MALDPITREENFLARIAGDDGKVLSPITREEHFLQRIIDAGGGGGSVTPASIVTATGQMTDAQAATTRENLGAEPEKFVVTLDYDQNDNLVADKTLAEIWDAFVSGKSVTCFGAFPLTDIEYEEGSGGYASFTTCFSMGTECLRFSEFFVSNNGVSDKWEERGGNLTKDAYKADNSNSSVSITPEKNTIYNCTAAALTSLTVTNPPSTGAYSIIFTSGSTPTQTTFPATILGLEDFAAEANTMYEINVLDNRAVVGSWAVSV